MVQCNPVHKGKIRSFFEQTNTLVEALVRVARNNQHFFVFLGRKIIKEVVDRIDFSPVLHYLIMQVRCGRRSCRSDIPDDVSTLYTLPSADFYFTHVSVQRFISKTVVNDDMISVS